MKSPSFALCTVALAGAALSVSGCSRVQGHQGYIVDPVTSQAIAPGVDNKQSVEATLGRPTFTATFQDDIWYYVSRDTRQFAFAQPSPKDQLVMKVSFDRAGNVVAVDRTGIELVANINPEGDETPTLGRDRSFFEDVFGNVGAVGAPGGAGGRSNDPTRP